MENLKISSLRAIVTFLSVLSDNDDKFKMLVKDYK